MTGNQSPFKDTQPRVAVVGTGYWGRNLVRNFHELGALERVFDSDIALAQGIIAQYQGVTAAGSYDEILADPTIRGVVIATPAVMHYALAHRALQAGKDVLVEKPLALEVSQGRELVELAERKAAILMVGHILLYHPAVLKLKEIIDRGELGRIQYIHSNRLSMGKVRSEENILWSFAPHDVSMICYLLGELPSDVSAAGSCHLRKDVEDVTISTMTFPSGVGSHIHVCWMHPFKEHRLVVIGDRKTAVFEDSRTQDKLQVYDCTFEWVNREPLPRKGPSQTIEVPADEPLKMECSHFLECIRSRQTPRSDGREGLRTLEILQECCRSLKSASNRAPSVEVPRPSPPDYYAHPTAVIDEPCTIGASTRIWHFSHVMEGSSIGERCNIGANVLVGKGVRIGNGCKIQNNVSVYEGVTLEDYVFCGPSMVFTNVFNPRCEIPRMKEIRHTLVKRGATIGANATIVCGNTVGKYAFIGAGSVVTKDVPDYALMVGNPAARMGWMCRCGNRLPGDGVAGEILACRSCADAYIVRSYGLEEFTESEPVKEVPLLDLKSQGQAIRREVLEAIERVVDKQQFILGSEVESLEREIAEYCGCRHAVGVSSGTDALLIALIGLGVTAGDEVITTPFTFIATVGSILRVGARPVFVDIDPETYNMDPAKLEQSITSRTRAIIPIHLFGQCADMDTILKIAEKRGIPVIEDAAQAIGSSYKDRPAGSLGTVGCFSFFPSKNLGAFGDGGMVTTNDAELAERMRLLRNHGGRPKYHYEILGGNFRLDALQAAVLRVKLKYLEQWIERRRDNAAYYSATLQSEGIAGNGMDTPAIIHERHCFNQYVIWADNRDALRSFLGKHGIATEIYYPEPLHLQKCLPHNTYIEGDFPVSEEACQRVLALPIYPELSDSQKDYVVSRIVEFYQNTRRRDLR